MSKLFTIFLGQKLGKKSKLEIKKPPVGVKGLVPSYLAKSTIYLFQEIEKFLQNVSQKKLPIFISGYSSGGCLAMLFAQLLVLTSETKYLVRAVYTYGSLPVGNDEWK